jgi:hypothetical protein
MLRTEVVVDTTISTETVPRNALATSLCYSTHAKEPENFSPAARGLLGVLLYVAV